MSAALTATNRNKSVLLLGSRQMSEKVAKAHEIRNYPGLPAVKGEELAEAFRNHLDSMGITITEKRVGTVYAMGDYFALQIGEEMAEAETVILATGVVQANPLPGEKEMLGRGVSYCATCDAPLYRGKTAAVIGYSPREEAEAAFLSEVCSEVTYFPMYKEETNLPASVRVIREKATGIVLEDGKRVVRTENGSYAADGVFVAVGTNPVNLGWQDIIPCDGSGYFIAGEDCATQIPGIYAAGDVRTKDLRQIVTAAADGANAVYHVEQYLAELAAE